MKKNGRVIMVSHTANFHKFNRPFMRWFKSQGWTVDYLSSNEEEVLDADNVFEVKITRSPVSLANIKAIFKTRKILKANHYDLVHCHTPMGGVVARLAAAGLRKKGLKVVYTAHGFHFFRGAPKINWLVYYSIEKIMAFFSDAVITMNGEDFKTASDKFHTKVYKIDGVGVDTSRFEPPSKSLKSKLRKSNGYKDSDEILINVGELNRNKNQTFIIESLADRFKADSSLKLLICGVGDTKADLEELIAKYELESQIKLAGYVNNVDEMYQLADVLLSVSYREGLPVNLIEAMAVGLPIIATDVRGCRDVVENGRNGFLIDVDDQEGLVEALDNLSDTGRYKKIAKNNLSDVKRYQVETAVKNMADIYEEVLNV